MRSLSLALLLASSALAQQPAPTPPPAPAAPAPPASPAPQPEQVPVAPAEHVPVQPVTPKPQAGDILPEAQSVFDRAIAAYRGAKSYRETVVTTLRQRASGLPKDAEPPTDQASTTRFVWGGNDRFTFDTRDFALFRDGKTATIYVKVLGEYTQREPSDQDQRVFANMVDMNPVYQALSKGEPGQTVGRFARVTKVEPKEIRGVKGKLLTGVGLPPLPGFEILSPTTMFFADDTGLLMESSYDLKEVMQAQINRSAAPGGASVKLEQFLITSQWVEAKADLDAAALDAALAFKPGPNVKKVADFNMSDAETSAQHALLNTPAPEFEAVTLDGKRVGLKDLKGRVVMLQFWTTSNADSSKALTFYNSMNMEYEKRGVAMFGVNMDHATMAEQSRAAVALRKAAFPQIADPEKTIGNAYRVALVPCTVLIDKEGVIRSISGGYDAATQVEVAGKLDKLLKGEALIEAAKPTPFTAPGQVAPPPPPAPGDKPAQPAAPTEAPKP